MVAFLVIAGLLCLPTTQPTTRPAAPTLHPDAPPAVQDAFPVILECWNARVDELQAERATRLDMLARMRVAKVNRLAEEPMVEKRAGIFFRTQADKERFIQEYEARVAEIGRLLNNPSEIEYSLPQLEGNPRAKVGEVRLFGLVQTVEDKSSAIVELVLDYEREVMNPNYPTQSRTLTGVGATRRETVELRVPVWVIGVDTSKWVTDQKVELSGPFVCTGTRNWVGSTLMTMVALDASPWLRWGDGG